MKKLQKYIPILIFTISLLFSALFYNYYMDSYADGFKKDFEFQNSYELSSADIAALSRKLNSMTSAVHWTCIHATFKEKLFFNINESDCYSGWFNRKISVSSSQNPDIRVVFYFEAPRHIMHAILFFLAMQSILLLFTYRMFDYLKNMEMANNKMKVDLARQVAHDIKSPLAALKISLSQIEKDNKVFQLIQMSVDRISGIVNDLDFKSHSQKMHLINLSDAAIHKIINTLIEEKKQEVKACSKKIRLHLTKNINAAIQVQVDKNTLMRVVSNLLNNSIESIDKEGDVKVLLSAERNVFSISIEDNGCGIPSEILVKLFVQGFSYNKVKGQGLGLYSAKMELKQMGGDISLTSVEGEGTKVRVLLPLNR